MVFDYYLLIRSLYLLTSYRVIKLAGNHKCTAQKNNSNHTLEEQGHSLCMPEMLRFSIHYKNKELTNANTFKSIHKLQLFTKDSVKNQVLH